MYSMYSYKKKKLNTETTDYKYQRKGSHNVSSILCISNVSCIKKK